MMRVFIWKLSREADGSMLIETALVLPILLTLSLAFIDFAGAYSLQLKLMQAAHSGTDYVIASGSSTLVDSDIAAQVASVSGLPTSAVAIARTLECNGVAAPSGATSCPSASNDAVNYLTITVGSRYQPIAPLGLTAFLVGDQALAQSATVVLP